MRSTIARRHALALLAGTVIMALLVGAVGSRPARASGEAVAIWLSTADGRIHLQQQPGVAFAPDSGGSQPFTVAVTETQTFQQFDGVGAALTDSSVSLITGSLTQSQRTALLSALFSPTAGIGLNMIRLPIGASDFSAHGFYTYDDLPPGQTDPTLSHFSIAHDTNPGGVVPLLLTIKAINSNLKIVSAAWSAPAWMKVNQSLTGSKPLIASDLPVYATYLVTFAQAYAARGLPIYALTPGNEPTKSFTDTPGFSMTATVADTFVSSYLGPDLAASGLSTKLLIFDDNLNVQNSYNLNYPLATLSDPAARPYVAGTSAHCYGSSPQDMGTLHSLVPGKDIYMTECSRGLVTPGPWAQAWAFDMDNNIIGAPRNWARAVIKWNVALDPSGGPGWCALFRQCFAPVTINPSTHQVSYNEDYYALGHIGRFVTPGAYRIDSNSFGSGSLEDVAFKNPDGSKALIVYNGTTSARTFKVRWGTEAFTYALPAGGAATFVWSGTPSA